MERLKKRWGIESNIQIILICVVFAINGSFAAWVAKPITVFLGLSPETMNPFLYWTFRFFLIFYLHITFTLRNQSLISLVFFHTVTQNVAQTCDY